MCAENSGCILGAHFPSLLFHLQFYIWFIRSQPFIPSPTFVWHLKIYELPKIYSSLVSNVVPDENRSTDVIRMLTWCISSQPFIPPVPFHPFEIL